MFDLCGFERFDLISALLEHRQELVKAAKETKAAIKMEIANAAASAPETAEALPLGEVDSAGVRLPGDGPVGG